MLFSFTKLKELACLPVEVQVTDVVNAINSIGFEVESYRPFTEVKGIKFGRVIKTSRNPNGDKLTVCEIEFSDQKRVIQTTANNVKEGMIIVAFVPGSQLGKIVFEAKELKGIVSEGMLSALSEFGVDSKLFRSEIVEGITSYPEVTDLTIDPITYLGLDDFIIDVKVLSNRADANSYFSMALEMAAYFGTKVFLPKRQKANLKSNVQVSKTNSHTKSLAFIEGKKDFVISVQDQLFLAKNNVKSINDIVDLTNLTLLMTGQPTHAYDKKIVQKVFEVKQITATVKVFGDKEVQLDNDLVVTNGGEIVSIAGVVGIEGKGISNDTTDFVIEMGRFDIKSIRAAAKSVKMSTNASNQSSKEFNTYLTKWAIDYISNIIPTFSEPINEPVTEVKKVDYSEQALSFLVGKDITKDKSYKQALDALTTIGYQFGDSKIVIAPHISGVESQQDLNEEILRFYGYETIVPQPPVLIPFKVQSTTNLQAMVATLGYQETVTYTLTSKDKNSYDFLGFGKNITLETFVSKEREEIRNSIVTSLLEIVLYNQKRKMEQISIFEIGMVNNGVKVLGLASTTKTFEEMANDIQNIISYKVYFERLHVPQAHSGVTAKIMLDGEMIGWIGKIHPALDETKALVAEVKIISKQSKVVFKDYVNNQLKQRDVTIAIGQREDMSKVVEKFNCFSPFSIKLIDQFLKEDKNYVTFRVVADEQTIAKIDKDFK